MASQTNLQFNYQEEKDCFDWFVISKLDFKLAHGEDWNFQEMILSISFAFKAGSDFIAQNTASSLTHFTAFTSNTLSLSSNIRFLPSTSGDLFVDWSDSMHAPFVEFQSRVWENLFSLWFCWFFGRIIWEFNWTHSQFEIFAWPSWFYFTLNSRHPNWLRSFWYCLLSRQQTWWLFIFKGCFRRANGQGNSHQWGPIWGKIEFRQEVIFW